MNDDSTKRPAPFHPASQDGAFPVAAQTTDLPLAPDITDTSVVGRGDNAIEVHETEGLSQSQIIRRRFFRHKGALGGMIILGFVVVLSLSSIGIGPIPGWWKYHNPLQTWPMGAPMGAPTWDHPFGQDTIGRDNFACVMSGIKTSLLVMVILVLTAVIVGVAIGALSGFYRGRVDLWLMRVTDLFITLPTIVIGAMLGKLLSSFSAKFGLSNAARAAVERLMPVLLGFALGFILWTSLARLVRAEFLTLREREFVESARVAGASDRRIIMKHILPNAMGVIIVNASLLAALAVTLESALSFLGFGINPPNISLGYLISTNQSAFQVRPWLFWWPGLFIILLALSMNFIGDGLRDAFDPRTKRIPSKREMLKAMIRRREGMDESEPAAPVARRAIALNTDAGNGGNGSNGGNGTQGGGR